jgi:large subunit ribosomal protein L28
MSKYCPVTGKKPVSGNRVSHANNKSKRVFEPNLHEKRLWSPALGRFVRLRVSARALRTIDKRGVDVVLGELKQQGVKF